MTKSDKIKALWKNPRYRRTISIKAEKQWKNQKIRDNTVSALKKKFNTHKFKEEASRKAKILWRNPEYQSKMKKYHQNMRALQYKIINNKPHKKCPACNKFVSVLYFNKNKARNDGLCTWCKTCESTKSIAKRNTLDGWIRHILNTKRGKCKRDGIRFTLNHYFLLKMWELQNGRCYYTGIPLRFNLNALDAASLERINPTKGYVVGNVVLASQAINHMKGNATIGDLGVFMAQLDVSHVQHVLKELDKELSEEE